MSHEEMVCAVILDALHILKANELKFRPMRRRGIVNTKKTHVLARINLKTKLITIDIYTTTNREPKKMSSILRHLCHEVAHHQKPPYYQFFRRRWIVRQHFPKFYRQVQKNIDTLKEHHLMKEYF